MFPIDLKEEDLTLPDTNIHSIVIVSGSQLRHR